jgi:hypothetical protein
LFANTSYSITLSNVSSATNRLSPLLFLQLLELADLVGFPPLVLFLPSIRSLLRNLHLPDQFCHPATQPPACFNIAREQCFLFTANSPSPRILRETKPHVCQKSGADQQHPLPWVL